MSVSVDPQEVLFHLEQLGFHDVSPQQLTEFIRDLKRLISYDRQKRCSCRCTCQAQHSSVSSDSAYLDTSSSSEHSSGSSLSLSAAGKENAQAPPRQRRLRTTTVTLSDMGENRSDLSSECSSVTSSELPTRPKSVNAEPKKAKSTFIRPWHVGSVNVARRGDPVALYHHYQALWNKQKFPGEDDRADLRWTVRNKMLGQIPHPQPRGGSLALSQESLPRRRPRL